MLPLLGIQYIEDRDQEYPDWNVPRGYDMTMVFGTYQVDVVRACSEQIALRLGRWAGLHSATLLKEADEPNRLVMHAKIPEYGGIIAFVYRVFRKPPRARFTADFVDRKGRGETLMSEMGMELNERYRLAALASEVRRDMRCLRSRRVVPAS